MFFLHSADPLSNRIQSQNYVIAFLTGTISGIAWWIMIDILSRSTEHDFDRLYLLPGIAISLMLMIIHFIPDAAFNDETGLGTLFDSSSTCCGSTKCARISLFTVFLVIFSSVIASIWIFVVDYATSDRLDRKTRRVQWFGAGNMLFTILLGLAALFSRFARKPTDSILI